MDLQDGPVAYFSFLKAAVQDRGTASFEEVSRHARMRDLELQSPAMATLVAWGAIGLDRIVEIALSQDSSKATSAALKVLSSVAARQELGSIILFIEDRDLINTLQSITMTLGLHTLAREKLHELVFAIPTRDLLIPLGISFSQMALSDPNLAEEIVAAISTKWLRFGPKAVKEYSDLIKSHPDDEPAFHDFFERYPQFLDPMAMQVWSKPHFHGALEPDFLIRRNDDSYLVVEIECPAKLLMTRGNQLSADATHAEKQATDYRAFLSERVAEARIHFPNFRSAECMAVIGCQGGLSLDQKEALSRSNGARHDLKTVGFDWLSDRANTVLANLAGKELNVLKRYRVI